MSPEQARGQAIDKRTDIWAFGCVLFEMITGRLVFRRRTISDTIAAVLERSPDWTALPPATPPPVRHVLARCLEKDPKQRWRDIGDVRIALEDAEAWRPQTDSASPKTSRAERTAWALLVALTAAVAAVLSPMYRKRLLQRKSDSTSCFPAAWPLTSRSLRSRRMVNRSSWRRASASSSPLRCGCDRWLRRPAGC